MALIATGALALLGCAKELEEPANKDGKHIVQVTLSKPEGTKTTVVEVEGETYVSYIWNDNDGQYFRVTENGNVGTVESFALSQDKTIATLTVSFPSTSAPYEYEAKYAGAFTSSSPYNPKHPAEQTPSTKSFDPAADVLVSKVITSETRPSDLTFTMGRIITVNKMTLTGLTAGEVISKVEITLDKTVNGSTSISYKNDTYSYNGTSKLTLNYDSTTGVVPEGGSFPVYFTSAPVDAAHFVSVSVTTDQHIYTKPRTTDSTNPFADKTISFAVGTMTQFNMGLAGYGSEADTNEYTLYSGDLTEGDYIIYYSGYAMKNTVSNNRLGYSTVSPQNNVISNSDPSIVWHIAKSGNNWTIYNSAGNKYAAGNGTKNQAQLLEDGTDDYCLWTVSGTATYEFVNNKNNAASVNANLRNNGNNGFACYSTSTGGALSLYKKDYTIEPTYDFTTVAELNALATSSTGVTKNGKLTNAVVSFVPNTSNAIIKDETGSVLFYNSGGHGLLQGQTFSGDLEVTVKLYNKCAEITACDAAFTGSGTVVNPENVSLSELVGKLSIYQNAYVKVDDLEVTSISDRNIFVKNGDNTYVVYYPQSVSDDVSVGDIISATGTIANFSNKDQIKVWSTSDIEVTGHVTRSYTITITAPTQTGCSITATVDDEEISSGDSVESGKTVNLTATANNGYRFNSWDVKGATVVNATAATTSFVVGAENVSISASFVGGNTDVLTRELIGVTGTSYAAWEDVQHNTDAVYAGQSAAGNSAIQLRSTAPSGIVTTASGGYAKKVTVSWESHTGANRTLNVYGKNTAYESAADLYGDNAGVLIGTIVNGTSTELVIPYDCQYIGLRSNDGAMYLSQIRVEWSSSASGTPLPTPKFKINLPSNVTGGTVSATKENDIAAGESVKLTVSPAANYELKSLMVDDVNVTSSVNADGEYSFSMPAHDVTVTVQFQSTSSTEKTATFAPSNFSGQGTSGTGSEISATVDGVTFACDKGYGTTQIRCYSGGKITISGKTITAISFTFSGSYTGGLDVNYTNLSTTSWEKTLSSQARITAVTVTYTE